MMVVFMHVPIWKNENLHITVLGQFSILSFDGVFLIDSCDEIKNKKQVKFIRRDVSLSGDIVPFV